MGLFWLGVACGRKWEKNEDRWIPVNERLPEDEEIVQVYNGKANKMFRSISYAVYKNDYWYDPKDIDGYNPVHFWSMEITHWKKRPQPPEGGDA